VLEWDGTTGVWYVACDCCAIVVVDGTGPNVPIAAVDVGVDVVLALMLMPTVLDVIGRTMAALVLLVAMLVLDSSGMLPVMAAGCVNLWLEGWTVVVGCMLAAPAAGWLVYGPALRVVEGIVRFGA
jgi:hypothetical protein